MQTDQATLDNLTKCTVAIQEAGVSGKVLGSGVIVKMTH